jgi:hypothetical protein
MNNYFLDFLAHKAYFFIFIKGVFLIKISVFLICSMKKDKLNILIEGCIKSKPKARKDLFEKYHRMLMGTCLRYARDKSEAEDILLDAFMQIYSKIAKYMTKICNIL